jgi:peptidoglycan/LPS O-acetylase OafA/YrhL
MQGYRKDIDGLRAFAILAVVLFHTFPKGLRGGFVGVDVFFVISGYLIAGIIDREIQAQRFSIPHFYARRVRRIFPALLVVLIFVLLIGAWVLLPGEYRQLGLHVAAGVGFVENIILWQEAGYFDGVSEEKLLLHLWSLAVEEQFYLIFPMLLVGLHRGAWKVSNIVLLLAVVSFFSGLKTLANDPSGAFFLPQNRIWELLSGAWIALSQWPHRFLGQRFLREGLSIVGVLLLMGSTVLIRREMGFPGVAAIPPVLGTGLLILTGPQTFLHQRLLSSRPFVGLGLISYPLYLWHWVLLALGHLLASALPATGRLALIALSFVLAVLTTRYIEQPIRFGSPPKLRIQSLCGFMLVMGVLGLGVYAGEGIPRRFKDPRQQMATHLPSGHKEADASCVGPLRGLGFCRTIGEAIPAVALIGDSHSLHLVEGLKDAGLNFLLLGQAGCPPFLDSGLGGGQCPMGAMNPAYDEVLRHPEIKTVIIAGRFGLYWHGQIPVENRKSQALDFPLLGPSGGNNPTVFAAQAEATVKALVELGKQVVWVVDVPELGFDPHQCIRRPDWLSRPKERCGIPWAVHQERTGAYKRVLESLARRYPDVRAWDASTSLCHTGFCSALTPMEILYQDDDHLSQSGSEKVGGHLVRDLPLLQ